MKKKGFKDFLVILLRRSTDIAPVHKTLSRTRKFKNIEPISEIDRFLYTRNLSMMINNKYKLTNNSELKTLELMDYRDQCFILSFC